LAPDKEKAAFIRRLEIAAKRVGSFYALAKQLGVTEQTLHNYRTRGSNPSRGSDPSRRMLIQIADAAGVSVEWLATGKDRPALDVERLREVIEGVEDHFGARWLTLAVHKKAGLISEIYEEITEQENKQIEQPVEPRPKRILRLVEKLAA